MQGNADSKVFLTVSANSISGLSDAEDGED